MRKGLSLVLIATLFFSTNLHAQSIMRSEGGPAISWSCELLNQAGEKILLSGVFDKIPADPKRGKIDGYKVIRNNISQDTSGFFKPISDASVNDIGGEFRTTNELKDKNGIYTTYYLDIALGDDGIGLGYITSYSDKPENYKVSFENPFIHERNLATGFCKHDKKRLRTP
jgi:hypothetical protein